jgi:PAS domain S-box-containing protein
MIARKNPPSFSNEGVATLSPPRRQVSGTGEMADLTRARDWASTPLGPIHLWSDTLLSSVNLLLSCRFPTVILWGPQMIQFYNDEYLPLMSRKHPTALGQPARACWSEAWHIIGPQWEAVLATGETVSMKEVLVPVIRDGRLQDIYWTYSYSPIYNPDGTIEGILILCHDVTDEVVSTRQLRESRASEAATEERLRLALAAADGIGTWDWDVANDLVYTDADFAHLYGVSPARAAAGITIAEFTRNMPGEDRDRVTLAIDKALRTGDEFNCEYRLNQSDGSVRWVCAVGRCTFAPDGTPTRFPGVTIDITDRKRTEEALRESSAQLSAIYSVSQEYTGILTPAGVLLDCNRASLEFAGNTCEDVIGLNFWDTPWFTHTPGGPEIAQQAIARAASGEFVRQEIALTRPSGEILTFDFSLAPVRDSDGKVIFLVPEGRDITELKRAEAALIQSEKLAAVGRLASSIAHEINNPLESVMNLIYLARQYAIVPEAQHFLDIADQEIRRVSIIANQTLRFHKQPSNPQAITCVELFNTVLGIYEGKLRNSGIKVEKRKRAQHPVVCFEGDIRQILNNLVGNAIDVMPSGGRLILRSREATHWPTGRKGLTLTIADTGSGIEPEVLQKIFDPFFTTKGIGGTGLGLWVSQEIAERHHGVLKVRSSQRAGHSGTVFSLFLPFDATARR